MRKKVPPNPRLYHLQQKSPILQNNLTEAQKSLVLSNGTTNTTTLLIILRVKTFLKHTILQR